MSRQIDPLNEIFDRYYQDLIRWCRSRVRQELGDPEDIVHSAYLRCRRRWSAAYKSNGNEAAYLYQALRWVILDAVRKHIRERSRMRLIPRRGNEPLWEILHKLVAQEAVASLRGRQSQVCLAFLAGKSNAQICRELHLSAGAVAVHACRARATLCRFLDVSDRSLQPRNTRP